MHRNVTAAVVQLLGIAVAIVGAFSVSVPVGLIAVGIVLAIVGLELEGDR